MRLIIVAISTMALAAAFLGGAFFIDHPLWQAFLAGVSSSLLVLGMSIVAINIYLESSSRKDAVKALFVLSQESINNFHNSLMRAAWGAFGREAFGTLMKELQKGGFSPEVLKFESRKTLYDIYAASQEMRLNTLALEATLAELSRMMGWSLDATMLAACLAARAEIAKLSAVVLDDEEASVSAVAAGLIRVDVLTQLARERLMKIAGLKD